MPMSGVTRREVDHMASLANAEQTRTRRNPKDGAAREGRPKKPAKPKQSRRPVGERLEEMLRQPGGVAIAEVMDEFGILEHSARAVLSVEKRKRGLKVEYNRESRRYRVAE